MLTEDLTVSSALAELAATTGNQPLPLAAIEDRARRMRRGRRAGRAGIVVICVAAVATGIGLGRSGEPKASELTAFGAPPVVLPLCTAIAAEATTVQSANGSSSDAPTEAKRAGAGAMAPPTVGQKFKAPGTVTGTSAANAVTILVAAPLNSTSRPVTFAITSETQFFHGGQPTTAGILRSGGKVGFVATKTGPASYRLDQIDTNPESATGATQQRPNKTDRPPPGGDSAGKTGLPPIGQAVEGKGSVAAALGSKTVSLTIGGGPLAGNTLPFTVTPATRFVSGGRQCDPSGLPAGTPVGFAVTRTGITTYRLDQLDMA
jgi:hypothetical protein